MTSEAVQNRPCLRGTHRHTRGIALKPIAQRPSLPNASIKAVVCYHAYTCVRPPPQMPAEACMHMAHGKMNAGHAQAESSAIGGLPIALMS